MSKIDVLGVKVDTEKKNLLLEKILARLQSNEPVFIVTPYSEFIVRAQTDEYFKIILNSADFAIPDGMGILWAAHVLKSKQKKQSPFFFIFELFTSLARLVLIPDSIKNPIEEKISGSDFIWDLGEMAKKNNYSVFLLGGFDDTAEIVGQILQKKYPMLKIVGSHSGNPSEEGIVEKINSSKADFLFVAWGPVKQETWIYENRQNLHTKLTIGLGGTFDYIAGKKPLSPNFLRKTGLEWLWRLFTQPRRIARISKGIFGLIYYCLRH